jgi:hypothetical protein
MDAALRHGKWEGTIIRRRKDGQRFTARVVLTPRRDASGNPVGFLLISKDISQELRFIEGIRKAKLFDSTIVGSAEQVLDFIGNILESSTEYRRAPIRAVLHPLADRIEYRCLDDHRCPWNHHGYQPADGSAHRF